MFGFPFIFHQRSKKTRPDFCGISCDDISDQLPINNFVSRRFIMVLGQLHHGDCPSWKPLPVFGHQYQSIANRGILHEVQSPNWRRKKFSCQVIRVNDPPIVFHFKLNKVKLEKSLFVDGQTDDKIGSIMAKGMQKDSFLSIET